MTSDQTQKVATFKAPADALGVLADTEKVFGFFDAPRVADELKRHPAVAFL